MDELGDTERVEAVEALILIAHGLIEDRFAREEDPVKAAYEWLQKQQAAAQEEMGL